MTNEDEVEVAPDGSPVAVYLALPFGEAPALIHEAVGPGAAILELGCGVGRITRPLAALGHAVVAVDDSAAMLRHVTVAETVLGNLFELDLQRTFDAVVAASHLVNAPRRDQRRALLGVCRRHLVTGGAVLVERYEPGWARHPVDEDRSVGLVDVAFRRVAERGAEFDAEVTYRLGGRTWTQAFTAADVDDNDLAQDASACGLHVERWLDAARTWALLLSDT